MTTTEPTPQPASSADDTALADALANEHAAIYAYGLVSAHSVPDNNWLVTECLIEHRLCREECIAKLRGRSVAAPVAAAGYKTPFPVNTPSDATKLALQVEADTAARWRAVAELADNGDDRGFAVRMLTESAIRAARWRVAADITPASIAFPGGTET
ncbi:ferritin-like domain-containing protein [Mycobacterium sp. D16R24]|uniref:ferritin-like domain-containing protein n=1 Tax=Mycobacterium sp. D16R24 TaxID=1855656 RepID=UPI000994442C|nr:ferritin-like domain-containing protein [Mycobacterium sp. D16R24]